MRHTHHKIKGVVSGRAIDGIRHLFTIGHITSNVVMSPTSSGSQWRSGVSSFHPVTSYGILDISTFRCLEAVICGLGLFFI